MGIFLITLCFFLIVSAAMAVGYIFQNKTLAGSCGGLSFMGIEKACNCEKPCEKRVEREKVAANNENSIDIKNI